MRGGGVLVLYERGASGRATLAEGARAAARRSAPLTVLALAPQDTDPAACGVYTEPFNEGVRSAALDELAEARESLAGTPVGSVRYALLLEGRDERLESFVARGRYAEVLLPRRGPLGLRARRRARRLTGAGVGAVRLIAR
jgi:hypothetical protein